MTAVEAAAAPSTDGGAPTATTPPPPSCAGRSTGRRTAPSCPRDDDSAERAYVLDMFPYPSGDLHMGHAEAFVMGDIVSRYLRLKGFDVLHPIGWDSFGLPAENAAIQRGTHPAEWTYANIETQATSFRRYGLSLDWSRRLHTSDPEYYRWTQWLFLRFRERGLAYRKASFVNWCPKDQTVLANEQVVAGHLRALRHHGDQAPADPVVLQGHRVRPAAAGRHGATWRAAGPTACWPCSATGSAAPRAPTSTSPSPWRRLAPRRAGPGLHHPARHAVRGDVLRRRARGAAGRRARDRRAAPGLRGLPGADQADHRDRAAVDRPAQDGRVPGRARDQPGRRRADPGVRGRLRAGRVRHRRGHGRARARPARPRLRPRPRPGRPGRRRHRPARPRRDRRGDRGRRRVRVVRPAGRADRQGGRRGPHHRAAAGRRRRGVGGDVPAARLAAEPPALLGRPDPDHPLPGLRRGRRARRPAARRAAAPERARRWRPRAPRRWPAPPTG